MGRALLALAVAVLCTASYAPPAPPPPGAQRGRARVRSLPDRPASAQLDCATRHEERGHGGLRIRAAARSGAGAPTGDGLLSPRPAGMGRPMFAWPSAPESEFWAALFLIAGSLWWFWSRDTAMTPLDARRRTMTRRCQETA
jgi:hypothetical protein